MASVHTLVGDDSPCCGGRRAAAALGSVRLPCFLVPLWRAALHPWDIRAALVPPRGESSEGASVCAGGGTHPGRWPLVASWGIVACGLPDGFRYLLELWSSSSRGVSLVARRSRDGLDVVPLQACTDAQGRVLLPPPV